MPEALIVSAVRTPIATSYKGSLRETAPETLATLVVTEAVRRSGLAPSDFDDVILAEALAGGGDLARYAAVAAGMPRVPGQAVNRHCAGSLTAVGNAAAAVRSGMEHAVIAGGTHSYSLNPSLMSRVPGSTDTVDGGRPTFPYYTDETYGPGDDDTTLSVGWNVALERGLSRDEMDRWALRSHQRAVAAIDAGQFADELVPVPVELDGEQRLFASDEHPRRSSTLEKLASLKPLHPEIEGFAITAGNASGVNDAAAALAVVSDELATEQGLVPLARIRAWAAVGVPPHLTGLGAIDAAELVLKRAGLAAADVDLWEINEAFASVPVAAVRHFGLDEDKVNPWGSGCSLGHPIAASGARMLTTLAHELRRRGRGIAVATMCAAGGQGGAVVLEAV
ncbi:thiolase family protein [Amycolatopsis rhabdoformis]|uniref:Thiolase family protein n=1 Tax=Amycolatopsis rhabdoformis TaxID=1448059 RepID=A0ABZ1IE94_9PSEU|nr:thiolase family protein [Amycolatopsis rhabdoformis]WSE32587.1 thiolase family protein [Amycolatopsis rhabdoformis]